MIAINIPDRRIRFIGGLTQNEKRKLLEQVWYGNNIFLYYIFPIYEGREIRDLIYFEKDMSYYL